MSQLSFQNSKVCKSLVYHLICIKGKTYVDNILTSSNCTLQLFWMLGTCVQLELLCDIFCVVSTHPFMKRRNSQALYITIIHKNVVMVYDVMHCDERVATATFWATGPYYTFGSVHPPLVSVQLNGISLLYAYATLDFIASKSVFGISKLQIISPLLFWRRHTVFMQFVCMYICELHLVDNLIQKVFASNFIKS